MKIDNFFGVKAAQRLQSRRRLCGRRLAAGSSRDGWEKRPMPDSGLFEGVESPPQQSRGL